MEFSDKIKTVKPSAIREIFKVLGDPSIISLAGGNPDPRSFPVEQMQEIANEIFATKGAQALQYGITEGYPRLRQQIAERLEKKFNSFKEDKDTLLVLTGGQQGIDLTTKILCNEHDTIICEDPTFIGALNAFRTYNVNLCGVPVDSDGINIEALEKALQTQKNVKMLYLIPTFQNPMGVCMSAEKRKAVYELAKKYGVIILEDNPYGELRFAGEDIPTIKSLDTDGIVVYCGSFSKILSPGMRVGFVSAPNEIAAKLVVAKQVTDVHTNLLFQMIVSEYLDRYDLDKHIEGIRALYKSKNEAMRKAIEKYMPANVKATNPEGGIFLWLDLPEGMDSQPFSSRLVAEKKVAVVPGSAFLPDETKKTNGIRLNYSMPTEEQIEDGIRKIAEFLKEYNN